MLPPDPPPLVPEPLLSGASGPTGLRVLVTRPRAQADTWVRQLVSHGVDAQALPLLAIGPPPDEAAVAAAWAGLSQQRLVMFVSPNAAEQFLQRRPPGLAWPENTWAASPGPGTSEVLRQHGVPAERVLAPPDDAAQFDSETLWAVLAEHPGLLPWAEASVLIVRGEGGRHWLAQRMLAQGAQLDFLAAYRRQPAVADTSDQALLQQALAAPQHHLWFFSSAEAVDVLVDRLSQRPTTADGTNRPGRPLLPAAARALTTHPRIAERARAAGFTQVHETRPTLLAVVACIQSLSVPAGPPQAAAAEPAPATGALVDASVSGPALSPDPSSPPPSAPAAAPVPEPEPSQALVRLPEPPLVHPVPRASLWLWTGAAALVLALVAAAVSMNMAWRAQQRLDTLTQEMVLRQQTSQDQSTEARMLAQQAQESTRDAAAKVALLEARVNEVGVQRTQLEDLIQALSRSRDETLLIDIEAGIRVALQQSALSGSAEPMVAMLRQADERLERQNEPRLEGVRRAIARDLDRVRNAGVAEVGTLVIKIDEVVRLVDDLPLLSTAGGAGLSRPVKRALPPLASASAANTPAATGGWSHWLDLAPWQALLGQSWNEVRSLLRVTRIEHPESMLIAPEQAFFLRENLKLRLLNARLALLSRQFDTVQTDLQSATLALDRYYDSSSRRTAQTRELLRQVAAQANQGSLPRPEATLAALAAVAPNSTR